jgi:hypothetical protein
MNKYFIPKISALVQPHLRGKGAQLPFNQDLYHEDPYKYNDSIMDSYENYIKLNKLDKSVELNFPKQARRLSERRRPCEVRRQREEDERRAVDRNIVKGFCNWFMWTQAAYKPPTKGGKKK